MKLSMLSRRWSAPGQPAEPEHAQGQRRQHPAGVGEGADAAAAQAEGEQHQQHHPGQREQVARGPSCSMASSTSAKTSVELAMGTSGRGSGDGAELGGEGHHRPAVPEVHAPGPGRPAPACPTRPSTSVSGSRSSGGQVGDAEGAELGRRQHLPHRQPLVGRQEGQVRRAWPGPRSRGTSGSFASWSSGTSAATERTSPRSVSGRGLPVGLEAPGDLARLGLVAGQQHGGREVAAAEGVHPLVPPARAALGAAPIWSRSLRKSCSMGSRAKLHHQPDRGGREDAGHQARVTRGGAAPPPTRDRWVKSGCAGRWPGLGMGARRSQASTSGGVMR